MLLLSTAKPKLDNLGAKLTQLDKNKAVNAVQSAYSRGIYTHVRELGYGRHQLHPAFKTSRKNTDVICDASLKTDLIHPSSQPPPHRPPESRNQTHSAIKKNKIR